MEYIWKYHLSRRVWLFSLAYLVVFFLLAAGLYFLYEGEYLSAWFSSSILALLILLALSIPRKLRLNADRLRIDCLMDMTEVPMNEIAFVRRVDRAEMRSMIPLFGGWGFFGYYGYYLDVIQVDRVKIYASEWDHFVEITDIYEDRIYVSCSEPDLLVETINAILQAREEQ